MAYSSIVKPADYFNTVLYTGNGSNDHTITGVGFDTDLAWIKNRGGDDHRLFNKVRGVNKFIKSNSNAAETTDAIFTTNADGYVVTNAGEVNANNQNFVGWNWKCETAVSGTTTGGSSRSYSGRVNTTAGISIINYSGNSSAGHTIPHHLGVAPKTILVKNLGDTGDWKVYHASTTDFRYYLELNTTDATVQDSGVFDNVPTSSGFLVGSNVDVNDDNQQYIAYSFAEKKGYSKFGKYTGNGNADGTFVYTGFKPAFVIQKNSGAVGNWILYDNKRDVDNVADKILIPNSNSAEASACDVDLLSNGFKFRAVNDASSNKNGNTYIYLAFAEQPLVANSGTDGVPATAR